MSIASPELDVAPVRAAAGRAGNGASARLATAGAASRPGADNPYGLRLVGGVTKLGSTAAGTPSDAPRTIEAVKRTFDVVVAALAAILVAPVVLVLAVMIWRIDRRSPLYAQTRVGLNGAVIRVWKLRSMYGDAEQRLARHLESDPQAAAEWRRCFKLTDDPRILPRIGTFIRRTSLDELPQLWNVLRGDMSLVGPRPFPAYHMDSFDDEFRRMRTSVVPGLTGLWQITARSDGDLSDQRRWDLAYIANRSFRLDLCILVLTLPAVMMAKGAR